MKQFSIWMSIKKQNGLNENKIVHTISCIYIYAMPMLVLVQALKQQRSVQIK